MCILLFMYVHGHAVYVYAYNCLCVSITATVFKIFAFASVYHSLRGYRGLIGCAAIKHINGLSVDLYFYWSCRSSWYLSELKSIITMLSLCDTFYPPVADKSIILAHSVIQCKHSDKNWLALEKVHVNKNSPQIFLKCLHKILAVSVWYYRT